MSGLDTLIEGYRRFKTKNWQAQHNRWETLSKGQDPKIMVISCSDSRVDPAQIFDASPGEIFVVRNVANLVPPHETDGKWHGISAALEFAVTQLNISEIIVLGHGNCGGIHASLSDKFKDGFIGSWISLLNEARDRALAEFGPGEQAERALERETVRVSIENLQSFPFIRERVADGRLAIHGAYFSLAHGMLSVMDESGLFRPVEGFDAGASKAI